jgi:hypothetical protein
VRSSKLLIQHQLHTQWNYWQVAMQMRLYEICVVMILTVLNSFNLCLIVELASLEDRLQASRSPDEPPLPLPQHNTYGINISSSYTSLLSRSTRNAKALEGLELVDNVQLRDIKVLLHFKHGFAYNSSL